MTFKAAVLPALAVERDLPCKAGLGLGNSVVDAQDPARLEFLHETSAGTNMARRYGHAARRQRCVAAAPHGHWMTTTFIAGLRHDRITAPLVLDSPRCHFRTNHPQIWGKQRRR